MRTVKEGEVLTSSSPLAHAKQGMASSSMTRSGRIDKIIAQRTTPNAHNWRNIPISQVNCYENLAVAVFFLAGCVDPACAGEPCKLIHGRAHFYGGDGQLPIWHIGTHHEYEPDQSSDARVIQWLEAGVPDSEKSNYSSPASAVYLYADFLICPTEPLVTGAVQHAEVKSASQRRYVRIQD